MELPNHGRLRTEFRSQSPQPPKKTARAVCETSSIRRNWFPWTMPLSRGLLDTNITQMKIERKKRAEGSGEGFVAGGAEDGVELDEDVVVVGVLIVAGKTHGGGEGFGGCGEVAAFAEGEVGPAFLEAG